MEEHGARRQAFAAFRSLSAMVALRHAAAGGRYAALVLFDPPVCPPGGLPHHMEAVGGELAATRSQRKKGPNMSDATRAITLAAALSAAAPAGAEWIREGDRLYRSLDVAEASEAIAWGNEAKAVEAREAIRIDPPFGGVDRGDDKVTVFELYEYGAFSDGGGRRPWKRGADEVMERWQASLPERVEVVRIPIVNQYRRGKEETEKAVRRRELQLRMMMTAQATGVGEAIDRRFVETLDREPDTRVSRATAKEWITQAGVSPQGFEEAWGSEPVTRRVEHAKELHGVALALSRKATGRRSFRHEPPFLVVDGTTIVARNQTQGAERAFLIANAVIAGELAGANEASDEDARWRALYEEMRESRHKDVAWGREREPREDEVFVLDPPLPTGGDSRIWTEWFYTYVNRGWYEEGAYTTWLSLKTAVTMREWLERTPRRVKARIQARLSPVGSIPGESPELDEHHRIHQRMVLGAQYEEDWGISRKADQGLRRVLGYHSDGLSMREARMRHLAMRAGRVRTGAFRKAWQSERPEERAAVIDARFAEVTRQLAERAPGWLEAPRHPIILVDGKYLIQGSASGGLVPAIQVFNRLLRRELEASDR